MDECRRSGQIPAFGNWDYANDLPITQYFESARQAGLIRYCSSTSTGEGECDLPPNTATATVGGGGGGDLYDAVEFNKPHHLRTTTTGVVVSSQKEKRRGSKGGRRNNNNNKNKNKRGAEVKEESKVVKFKVEDYDVDIHKYTTHSRQQQHQHQQQLKKKKQQQYYYAKEKEMIINNNNYEVHQQQQQTTTTAKPVDEDLYKIPPHLLHSSKRKKMLGFLSRCLVPGCTV